MKNSKKSFVIATLLVACFIFLGTGIQTVKAVTLDELQAQIDALMAQIVNLQKEKAQLEQGEVWCHTFSIRLKYGDSNSEVQALETALQKQGFSVTEHSSNFMARFDEKMAASVVQFQEKYASDILAPYNISHGTGYVGPTTLAKLNELYGCNNVVSTCDARNISIWGWEYCTIECPCDAGEGDCDTDTDCTTGYCAKDVGANYGQDSRKDVCEEKKTISNSCYETDGALDVHKKGTINISQILENGVSVGASVTDYCFDFPDEIVNGTPSADVLKLFMGKGMDLGKMEKPSGAYLMETTCRNHTLNGITTYDVAVSYKCPDGCVNGACTRVEKSITVIKPIYNEQLQAGQTYTIKWTANGFDKMTITSDRMGGANTNVVKDIPASQGYYSWQVPADLDPGDNYVLRFFRDGSTYLYETPTFSIVVASTTCTDTDGGKDYFVKGTTKGLAGNNVISTNTDYCSGDTLVEWFCSGEYRTNTNYTCPYGCSDGACIGRCPDINNDNIVNYLDLAILADSMDYCSGHSDYNDLADLTGDGCVDNTDLQYLQRSDHWLKNRSSIPVCLKLSNVWDIDDNGVLDPEIDGKIIQRYLFEIRGDALLGNGVGANAKRSYNEIIIYLDSLKNAGALDVDNNGQSDGGSDSLIIYRYMAGFTGSALIKDAVASNATRTSVSEIQTFLECENNSCLSDTNQSGLGNMEKQLASASDAISQIIENLKKLMGN